MGDLSYDKEYLERKKRLRVMHQKLKNSKSIQEIYHRIMGSGEASNQDQSQDNEES